MTKSQLLAYQIYLLALHQTLQTTKMFKNYWANKFSETHNFNPFQSSLSLSIRAYFVFAVLLIPSFHVLCDNFYVSLNLMAVPTVRILIKFVTTAPFSWHF